jgi:deoxyribodipyrimidine photo-lyase
MLRPKGAARKRADAPVILWFRRDLRLADNPALAAAAGGAPIVPLFVFDAEEGGDWKLGAASRWWLHGSLEALAADLARLGAPLLLRSGPAGAALARLVEEIGASDVFWSRVHEPWAVARDAEIEADLRGRGVEVAIFESTLLAEPSHLRSRSGAPFRVFAPFWRALLSYVEPPLERPAPKALRAAPPPPSERLADWGLRPTRPDWAAGLRESWRPGEAQAQRRLADFLETGVVSYARLRDFPAADGASRLSPHLHWGEIGSAQIWRATRAADAPQGDAEAFLRELGWREFCHHLLAARPDLPDVPIDSAFARFPWARDEGEAFAAWTRGRTGYPFVDAGMRQLWRTGFMHNRLRMVTASFLVKHLLLPWREGERWFHETLVDADLADNAGNWQWVAGCGADAAPYFRIFNPVLQGERFDPEGEFVRRFVPELAGLDAKYIHRPWTAPESAVRAAGLRLGETYPRPIVDHAAARERALAAFGVVRGGG